MSAASVPGAVSRHPRLALALLAMSQLIFAVDFSIVFTALPSIQQALHFSAHDLQWVVSAYTLVVGGFLLLGGRAADLLGRRRMFIIALSIYAAASLAGGLADSQQLLIAARAVQGLGGALLFPATLSIINTTFAEGPERNRALGIWGAAGASGGAIGVFLGGVLTQTLGWEWVLFVNVPIAAAAALLAPWLLPADPPAGIRLSEAFRVFDLPGALLATSGVLLLVYGLIQGPVRGWSSADTLIPLIAAVAALGVFGLVESRAHTPLLPVRLLGSRTLVTALIVAFIFMAVFGSQLYLLNLWLQDVRGLGAFGAALAMLPLSVSVIIGTQAGVASGITSTAQQVGNPIGLSILVAIANTGQSLAGGPSLIPQLNAGLQSAFLVTTVIALLAAVTVLILLPRTTERMRQTRAEPV